MPWNVQTNRRTLNLQKLPNGKYRLEQFTDILTNEGVSYREPIPAETIGLRYLEFDAVQIRDGQTPTKRSNAGQIHLIKTNSVGLQSRTAPA